VSGKPSISDSCFVPGLRVEGGSVRRYSLAILEIGPVLKRFLLWAVIEGLVS
jgi:hypothetical protein